MNKLAEKRFLWQCNIQYTQPIVIQITYFKRFLVNSASSHEAIKHDLLNSNKDYTESCKSSNP
jgi:hypothetical protein